MSHQTDEIREGVAVRKTAHNTETAPNFAKTDVKQTF